MIVVILAMLPNLRARSIRGGLEEYDISISAVRLIIASNHALSSSGTLS